MLPCNEAVQSFKCLVYNGVLGTGLSFSPNSAFSAVRHDPSLQAPAPHTPTVVTAHYRCMHTYTHTHTQRLPTAAGVSERRKWPIFSPFHLNNKQGVMCKIEKGREKRNWADKGYFESQSEWVSCWGVAVRGVQ